MATKNRKAEAAAPPTNVIRFPDRGVPAMADTTRPPSPAWPFPLIDERKWLALTTPEARAFVQFKLDALLAEIESRQAMGGPSHG